MQELIRAIAMGRQFPRGRDRWSWPANWRSSTTFQSSHSRITTPTSFSAMCGRSLRTSTLSPIQHRSHDPARKAGIIPQELQGLPRYTEGQRRVANKVCSTRPWGLCGRWQSSLLPLPGVVSAREELLSGRLLNQLQQQQFDASRLNPRKPLR